MVTNAICPSDRTLIAHNPVPVLNPNETQWLSSPRLSAVAALPASSTHDLYLNAGLDLSIMRWKHTFEKTAFSCSPSKDGSLSLHVTERSFSTHLTAGLGLNSGLSDDHQNTMEGRFGLRWDWSPLARRFLSGMGLRVDVPFSNFSGQELLVYNSIELSPPPSYAPSLVATTELLQLGALTVALEMDYPLFGNNNPSFSMGIQFSSED